jgi:hypothetical protein
MKHLALCCLFISLALPASAEIKGCYGRKYDVGVLKRHPKQIVTSVTVRYGVPPNDQEGFLDDVSIKVRGNKTIVYSAYDCTGSKSSLTCKLSSSEGADGVLGTFNLKEIKGGITLNPTSDLKMGDLDTQKPYTLTVTDNPEHKTFTLKKLNMDLESCEIK